MWRSRSDRTSPFPNALKIYWRFWGFGSHGLVVRFGSHSELLISIYIERVTTVSKLDTKIRVSSVVTTKKSINVSIAKPVQPPSNKIDWRLWGFGSHGLVVRFGSHSELLISIYIERVTTVSKLDTKYGYLQW